MRIVIVIVLVLIPVGSPPAHAADSCSPAKTAIQVGVSEHTLTSDGGQRRYLLHIPPGYAAARRTPLVISLHGFASSPRQQMYFSRWDDQANRYGFITVFPEGTGFPLRWNAGANTFNGKNDAQDVQFVRDLITELSATWCIDPARIYANGLSNGGGMSNRIACEMADTVAAVGMVAGAYSAIPGGCHPARPIPVIAFHGTADTLVDYSGNQRAGLPVIRSWAEEWAIRNGCDAEPERIEASGDASGIRFKDCTDKAEVILYTIDEGGHTWPGGRLIPFVGKTSMDIDATDVMWQFFQAHPLVVKP